MKKNIGRYIYDLTQLKNNVLAWAKGKKILTKKKGNVHSQLLYISSELSEFLQTGTKDDVGDVLVTIINTSYLLDVDTDRLIIDIALTEEESARDIMTIYGEIADNVLKNKDIDYYPLFFELGVALKINTSHDMYESLKVAYKEISARTGKTVGGVFIKEETEKTDAPVKPLPEEEAVEETTTVEETVVETVEETVDESTNIDDFDDDVEEIVNDFIFDI